MNSWSLAPQIAAGDAVESHCIVAFLSCNFLRLYTFHFVDEMQHRLQRRHCLHARMKARPARGKRCIELRREQQCEKRRRKRDFPANQPEAEADGNQRNRERRDEFERKRRDEGGFEHGECGMRKGVARLFHARGLRLFAFEELQHRNRAQELGERASHLHHGMPFARAALFRDAADEVEQERSDWQCDEREQARPRIGKRERDEEQRHANGDAEQHGQRFFIDALQTVDALTGKAEQFATCCRRERERRAGEESVMDAAAETFLRIEPKAAAHLAFRYVEHPFSKHDKKQYPEERYCFFCECFT